MHPNYAFFSNISIKVLIPWDFIYVRIKDLHLLFEVKV